MIAVLRTIADAGWTPGAYGIWLLVLIALGTLWKGSPAFITALSNRQSKVEERMSLLLKDTTDRFSREIAEADKRHDECVKGQDLLRDRIDKQDTKIREQQSTIDALRREMSQVGVSAIRNGVLPVSPEIESALAQLDKIDRPQ